MQVLESSFYCKIMHKTVPKIPENGVPSRLPVPTASVQIAIDFAIFLTPFSSIRTVGKVLPKQPAK